MPRTPKDAHFDATDDLIISHFDEAMELREQQRESRLELSGHNRRMQDDGCDPGVMAICRRLALMPEGKRGIAVALLHRYLQVLASRLEDPTLPATRNGEAHREATPFAGQRSAA